MKSQKLDLISDFTLFVFRNEFTINTKFSFNKLAWEKQVTLKNG